MIWIIALTIATYFQSIWNGFISDDITINSALKSKKYPLWDKKALTVPTHFFDCLEWRMFKDNKYLHHILSIVLFATLSCSFYAVAKKFIPEPVAFLAALIFTVHPCNNQVGAWISAKWWGISATIALWGLYFNSSVIYLFSTIFMGSSVIPFILLLKVSWLEKTLALILVFLFFKRLLNEKVDMANYEGEYKSENLKLYPRKIIVAIKSYCYYFTLAFFPARMGWFHEMGEPIDTKLKACNFHFTLCLLLMATLLLFLPLKAALGLFLFSLFISPFINLVTFALFTSERYMTPAIMGWSIFLSYLLVDYPVVAGVVISLYFARTQLQLWSFKDDTFLALSSLLNFRMSGYAWTNIANMMLATGKPSMAFDLLMETSRRIPTFPTTYWLLYVMYRSTDILNDMDLATDYLERAVKYGKHAHWRKELEEFKKNLRNDRITKFKGKYVTEYPVFEQLRRSTQLSAPEFREDVVGAIA